VVFWNPPAHKSHRYISRYPEIFEKKSRLIVRKTACCETSKLVSEWTCELWTVAELEDEEEHVINWSVEMTDVLGSRLYALWNRTAGDCLLDSVLQASWGVMDRDNTLRRALADSLNEAAFTYAPSPYHTHTHTHAILMAVFQATWVGLLWPPYVIGHHHTTTVLWPFFQDHPCKPVPEENFWILWCKGRLLEADTLTIWLGATPSRLTTTSVHLHHPPIFFTGRMPFMPPNQQCQSTEGSNRAG